MSSANAKMNPFPGLRPFTQEEDYLFFGREEQTLELLQRLGSNRFVAVVGTSGSGKSSLVRCGLLSELLGGRMMGAGSSWEIAVTHPGGNPLALLTDSLLEADLYDREEEHVRENLLATLSRSHFGLVEAVKQADLGEGTNFLLVVDQFEEIFRFQDAGQRQQEVANEFVSLLLEAVAQKDTPIYVVLTMRSDFIGECGQFEGLAEMVNRGEFLIPRLTREQYKRVIEGPIKVAGGQIAPRLLQRLLNDLSQQADQLPCLQHALMRTWDVWAQKKGSGLIDRNGPEGAAHQLDLTPFSALDLDDYQRVGKMTQALSLHADEIYESLGSDRQRELCKGLFQALTVEESNNRGIRRPQRLGRLCQILEVPAEELVPIIDAYRHSGVTFLMPSPDVELTDQTIIDISHESLMRVWTRLRQWVEEESQAAGIYHRLAESAALHELGKAGLYRDPELGIALAWQQAKRPNAAWAERYRPGFAAAMAFLESSQQASVADEQAREAARQRELAQAQRLAETERQRATDQARAAARLRWMVRGLGLVAMVAIMATVFAWLARQEANRNADTALQAQQDTERALKEAEAAETLAKVNEAEAERQKAAAMSAEQRSREFRYATDIELAARMVNDKNANAAQLSDRLADFDPTMSKSLVAAGDMRGFEWYYLKKLVDSRSSAFSGFNKPVIAAAVTSEGVLITLDEEAQVRRFDAGTKQERGTPTDLKKGRNIVAKTLSPDGQRIAIAIGSEVQIFDSVSGEQIGRSIPTQVRGGLIFSPDSRMLITMDTGLGWWDAATCKPIAVQDFQLTIFINPLQPLSTSADGLTLAVGGQGTYRSAFSVFQLDPKTREITRLLDKIGAQGTKRAMAISPDGGVVAISLYFQGGIYVYETATGKLLQSLPSAHSSAISAIAFRKDSEEMVTASLDGTIKLWNDYRKLDSDEANTFIGHAEEVNLLSILPGDKQLLSASSDKTVRVWNLGQSKAELHKKLAGAIGNPRASFSSDGTLIATPGGLTGKTAGNRLRIWDAATGQPAMEFPEGSRTDLSADSVAFSPDGRLLAAGFGGIKEVSYIELWDIDRRERIGVLPGSTSIPGFTTDENSGMIPGLAFSPDGRHLVATFGSMNLMSRGDTGNFPLLVYDVATRQVVRRLEGHRNFCMAVAFSRDGSRMASASQDGTARIWDTATWRELQVFDNPDTASESGQRRVYDVAFSPNGALLAMASAEGNVILFDVASGEVLRKLRGHSNEVRGVAFAPDGLTLASGSTDGTIRFWNTATWRELLRLEPEKGFAPYSISFSPDGDRLLASAYGTGGTLLWSIPRDGSTSSTTTEELAKLLDSNIDFRHRIRLLSDDLQLHEPLAILAQREPNRAEVNAALAATRAHWHAERSEWGQAVEQFDRLKLLSPEAPRDWLRTPGLLRLATALFHEGRSTDAASLLKGGEARRAEDGNGTRSDSFGFVYDPSAKPAKLTQVFRGSPAWNGGLRVGDAVLKINDIEVKSENRAKYQNAMQNPIEGKLTITFQHSGNYQPETAEIKKASYIQDDLTVELIENLLAAVDKKLSESANDPGLLELLAEIAGLSSEYEKQVADYTAAIETLTERGEAEATSDLLRLYARRGNAYVALKQWPQAVDDYARGVTEATTDEVLLSNQALAMAEVLLFSSKWKVLKPVEAKSRKGATLSILPDDSILASGVNLQSDRYRVVVTVDNSIDLAAVRLEALTHDSLPAKGPGRYPGRAPGNQFSGTFAQSFLSVTATPPNRTAPVPLQFQNVKSIPKAQANSKGEWTIAGTGEGQNCSAVWSLSSPVSLTAGTSLIFEMEFGGIGPENLGHFRLSLLSDLGAINHEEMRLASVILTDPWQKLAAAHRIANDQQAVNQIVERHPQSAGPISDLFIDGKDKNWQRAIEIYSKGITPETNDAELLSKRAKAYEALKDWSAAAADWQRAALLIPDGTKTLIEFAQRLANSDQPDLAMVARERALSLLETTLASDPKNVVAVDQMAGLLLDRDQRLEFGLASLNQDAMTRITALRVETSSDASPPAGNVPAFSEYQILSTKLPEQGFRGRFARLDLPGANSRFPRHPSDKNMKTVNVAEFQVFQGDKNIALGKPARQSSPTYPAERAVDGNTVGNDTNNSYAHTGMEENPWWEVDLGSEQAFDRMVVWNRSDVSLYPRMNHFRVQILDANRELVYERVIDQAPAPSTEIRRSVNWSQLAATDASESRVQQLNFGLEKDSAPPARIRVSGTAEVLRETTAERANDPGWVEIPNALNTPLDGTLALDSKTLAKIAHRSRLVQATKIADAPTRLAAAYELAGKPAYAAEQFRRILDRARTETEREAVLKELSNYPKALAELIQQRPRDRQFQIALARRHEAMGQKELAAKEPNAALLELQKARELFERLFEQHPEPRWTVLQPTEMSSEGGATLTLKDDGSVLASGKNPDEDTYTLKAESDLRRITAFRLEALPDPSLPKNGPGRYANNSKWDGNFHLNELRVFSGDVTRRLTDIAVTYDESNQIRSMIDGRVDRKSGWSVSQRIGQSNIAVIATDPVSPTNGLLEFKLFCSRDVKNHNLGRFRLSATGDQDAFTAAQLRLLIPQSELATLDVAIGKAYAHQGNVNDSVIAFARALDRFEKDEERQTIIETVTDFPTELSLLAEQRPQNTPLQLAMAKSLAEGGQKALSENRQDEALTELAQAREIFSRLVENHPEPRWTVLQPTQMTSEGGADMALEADGSIFVSGTNPDRATYSISIPLSGDRITALRLETIPDSRLPGGGAGRFHNGNFHVAEFSTTIASNSENGQPTPIVFSSVISDMGIATNMIDGNPGTRWDTVPKMVEAHSAIFALKSPTLADGGVMIVTLDSGITEFGKHGLGRFRLSATTGRDVIASARFHQELQAIGLLDLELALGNTYGRSGRLDEAATAFNLALNLATQRDARSKILQAASMHEGLLDKLRELRSADAAFHDALARFHQANGKPETARTAAATARTLYEKLLVKEPANSQLPKDLADLLLEMKADWTVLKPLKFSSRSGATLTPQPDGSVFVSGNLQAKETFTLDFADIPAGVTAIRLEALRDDRLPNGGPGTYAGGEFVLSEILALLGNDGQLQSATSVPLEVAYASFEERPAKNSLTPDESGWSIAGRTGQNHTAIFRLVEPGPTTGQNPLRMVLNFHHVPAGDRTALLGRFRLSVCAVTDASESQKLLDAAAKVTSPWARLGAAYDVIGESDRGLDMFARSIELAGTDQAKAAAAQTAAAFKDIFEKLQERFPDHKSLRLGQAKFMAAQHISNSESQSAVDVLSGILADYPNDIDLLNQRAGAFMKLANWLSADADYARVIELETDDGRRRAAERTRAEALVRMGQFQAGAEARLQEMMLSSEWDRMRDAYSAALLAGKPALARMVANRFFRTVSGRQDMDAYWSGELVRLHTAIPGLVTKENLQRLLDAATKASGDWTTPYTAAIHYRLGDLEKAQPLLVAPQKDREFHALAALLLYDQGETTRAAGFLNQAESWLQQESAKDPHSAIPAQVAWDIWAVSRTVWHEAARKLIGPRITELDDLLAKEPDRSAELLERARLLTNVGLVEDALRDLQSLVTQNVTSPESSALHGRILAGLGRDEEALPYLNQAIDSGSLDSDVYAARGTLLLKQRQSDAARVDLEKSIELKPNALAASSLADLLLSESNHWSVLEPVEMKSESGATLTRLTDNSILVSGLDPDKDSYTMTAAAGLPNITSLRLEAIPDPSLPSSGPGRAPNFVLTDVQVSSSAQAVQFAQAIATYEQRTAEAFYPAENAIDQDPLTGWAVYPRVGQSHSAFFQLKNPLTLDEHAPLVIVLHFKSVYPKHVLGRFRLSVSDDSAGFDREEKRLAAMRLSDPLARLAAAYLLMNDQPSLDKLIEAVPSVETSIAELYVTMKDWDRLIAAYSKMIGDKSTDASLFIKRGEAYFASKQMDLARADWRRAVELRPELAQTQFDRLRQAERWSEAAEFGLKLIEQHPEDTLVWLRIAPVLVLNDDPAVFSNFCGRMVQHFSESKLPETADRVVKACLLRADAIDLAKLPGDLLAKSLDDGTVPEWLPSWAWGSRALLAYRRGDAESGVKYVAKSEEYKPIDVTHAMNLAILTMAQHQLGKAGEAKAALEEASQLIARLKVDPARKGDHDLLIAEILFREAEALINEKVQPKESGSEEK